MSNPQIPPWLQEQIMKFQQSQQSLQTILAQKQDLLMQNNEIKSSLEELQKATPDDVLYKRAGTILIKSNREKLVSELEDLKELAKTKSTILEKQETHLKETIKTQEAKINEMITKAQSQQPPPPNP